MKIVTAGQMRRIDRRASDKLGIPSIVLMENAALAVVDVISSRYSNADRISIFCGPGQNGGDGFALARHLHNRGVTPRIFVIGDPTRIRGDAKTNLDSCERMGLFLHHTLALSDVDEALAKASDADLLVDSIFGTGLEREPEGVFAAIIAGLEDLRLPILAVDIPSGVDSSSGKIFTPSVRADITVTFALPKIAHVFEPSASICGEIIVADISIPETAIDEEDVRLSLTTPAEVRELFPPRAAITHKGTWGHVAILGGSAGRSGAAILAARGALRTGAGLVTVITDAATAAIIDSVSIESMSRSFTMKHSSAAEITATINTLSAAVIGPGLSDDEECYALVRDVVAALEVPLILDASGLNAFAGKPSAINPGRRPRVLTPHPGELARLLGSTAGEVNENRVAAAEHAARETGSVVVLKGHQTIVAMPDGYTNVNPTGNPGMATGGMGDVLSGMIGTLLGQGFDPFDAARAAAYIHGLAADMLLETRGEIGMLASEVADNIPAALRSIRSAG